MAKKKNNVVVQLRPRRKAKTAKRTISKSNQQVSAIGQALRALGGIGGSAAGAYFGAPMLGGTVGTGLGASLSRWLGSGDYTIASNSLVSRAASGSVPSMHKEGQSIIVRHKEYISEVRGAIAFTVRNQIALNPGLSPSFPWLAGIASQYSEYKVRGMVYHYVPTSGAAVSSTNPALGSVMIQTSYRATEALPTSKMEMLNEYWSSEGVPSSDFCHPIECDPKENPFNIQYVRTGKLPTTENQLMYDLGRTTVAVSGQQADDKVLGDLWVSYEIELKKPVLTNASNADVQSYGGSNVVGVTAANPFGTTANFTERFSSFPVDVTVTSTSITFAAGLTGSFCMTMFFSSATVLSGNVVSMVNGVLLPVLAGNSVIASNFTVGAGTGTNSVWFTITDPTVATILFPTFNTITGATGVRVVVTEINPLTITG